VKIVTPTVHLIGSMDFHQEATEMYLDNIGAPEFEFNEDAAPGEKLAEAAGRLCYKSWKPGLNPNVTKIREGNRVYIENILKSRHGSVLEHITLSFLIEDGSRIYTHEQVRHRAGVAYSQESLRYVRLTEVGMFVPSCIKNDPEALKKFIELTEIAEQGQKWFADHYKIKDFHIKKALTSAFRRVAPMGVATSIILTANIRALRHMIAMRTSGGAEEEIIVIYKEIASICQQVYPAFFQDMHIHDDNSVTFDYDKI
jgi:thymidylate synthase (FAD)